MIKCIFESMLFSVCTNVFKLMNESEFKIKKTYWTSINNNVLCMFVCLIFHVFVDCLLSWCLCVYSYSYFKIKAPILKTVDVCWKENSTRNTFKWIIHYWFEFHFFILYIHSQLLQIKWKINLMKSFFSFWLENKML